MGLNGIYSFCSHLLITMCQTKATSQVWELGVVLGGPNERLEEAAILGLHPLFGAGTRRSMGMGNPHGFSEYDLRLFQAIKLQAISSDFRRR